MSSNFQPIIDGIKAEISVVVEKIKSDLLLESLTKLHTALNNLEDLAGTPRTSLGSLLRFEAEPSTPAGSSFHVAPDEFYGLEPLEAAKRVLRKVGPVRKSAEFSEIVRSIRAGGGDPGNEDKLRISLARSTVEVAKVGDDRFGLLEFYPHVKRGSPGRKRKIEPEFDPATTAEVMEILDGTVGVDEEEDTNAF